MEITTTTTKKFEADNVPACDTPLTIIPTTGIELQLAKAAEDKEEVRPDVIVHSFFDKDVVGFHKSGFLAACMKAYDKHYPLTISPDVIWQMILLGFSKHVNLHAEELRNNFVSHKGKQAIRLYAFPTANDPKHWEENIFPGFSAQIGKFLGEKTYELLIGSFSTSTAVDVAVREITVMTSMQNYFGYYGRCCCGIPYVNLEGTVEDWESIVSRAKILGTKMIPDFWKQWGDVLIPVLEEIAEAANGKQNPEFWQKMVKEVEDPFLGSGSYNTLNGWINNFVPYWFPKSVNKHMKPWQNVSSKHKEGGATDHLPSCLEHTPVNWNDNGENRDFQFYAGVNAYIQDPKTFAIKPITGYFVVEEFEKNPTIVLERLKKEKRYLEKCQSNEDNEDVLNLIESRLFNLKWIIPQAEKGELYKE